MELIGWIIGSIISGLIIGALGRLVVPGPNPMSIGLTIAIGIGASFIGGTIGFIIGLRWFFLVLLEIAVAAVIVLMVQQSRRSA